MRKTAGLSATLALVATGAMAQDEGNSEQELFLTTGANCQPVINAVNAGTPVAQISGKDECAELSSLSICTTRPNQLAPKLNNGTLPLLIKMEQSFHFQNNCVNPDIEFSNASYSTTSEAGLLARTAHIAELNYTCTGGSLIILNNIIQDRTNKYVDSDPRI